MALLVAQERRAVRVEPELERNALDLQQGPEQVEVMAVRTWSRNQRGEEVMPGGAVIALPRRVAGRTAAALVRRPRA